MPRTPEAIADAFIEAWNRHDMDAFAALFTDDAQFVNVFGTWWKDRAQIKAAHEASHATMFKESRLSGAPVSVKYVRPDLALTHVRWDLTMHPAADGGMAPARGGILSLVLVRQNGGWLIAGAHNTDIVEPPT